MTRLKEKAPRTSPTREAGSYADNAWTGNHVRWKPWPVVLGFGLGGLLALMMSWLITYIALRNGALPDGLLRGIQIALIPIGLLLLWIAAPRADFQPPDLDLDQLASDKEQFRKKRRF